MGWGIQGSLCVCAQPKRTAHYNVIQACSLAERIHRIIPGYGCPCNADTHFLYQCFISLYVYLFLVSLSLNIHRHSSGCWHCWKNWECSIWWPIALCFHTIWIWTTGKGMMKYIFCIISHDLMITDNAMITSYIICQIMYSWSCSVVTVIYS